MEKSFHGDFYLTGDLAQRDEEGYLWFSSRNDDIIISAGYVSYLPRYQHIFVHCSWNVRRAVQVISLSPFPVTVQVAGRQDTSWYNYVAKINEEFRSDTQIFRLFC